MYVLQHHEAGVFTFTPFTYLSDLLHSVRTEYGITEAEYNEFMIRSSWERNGASLYWFEGEIPEIETLRSKAMADAFRAAFQAKK
jgi:hypothetical protein